jgi:hypothetical protein
MGQFLKRGFYSYSRFPKSAGNARIDQGLVADDPENKLIKIGAKMVSHEQSAPIVWLAGP